MTLCFSLLPLTQAFCAEPKSGFSLKVIPARCVVFREGQYCDNNMQIQWRASQVGAYCVYTEASLEPLKCWDNMAEGVLVIDKKITQSTHYLLRVKGNKKIIARDNVAVVWVYEAIRKNRATWRLF